MMADAKGPATWREVLIEDRHAGPSETSAARIDIADCLNSLLKHKHFVAENLGTSATTRATARKFGGSSDRISQARRELETLWQEFQGASLRA